MRMRTWRRDGVAAQRSGAGRSMGVVLAVALVSAAVSPAQAAFPGRNGVIAYMTPGTDYYGGPAEMWTVDPSSGAKTQLTDLFVTDGPAWSDDGRTLAFSLSVGREGFVIGVVPGRRPMAAPWTFGDAEWMTLPAPTSPPGGPGFAEDADPSWAPGGRRIVYQDRAGSLVVLDANDRKRVIVAAGREPAWSPDGRLIAFSRCVATGCSLWVVRPNGTGLRRLTNGTLNASAPNWSPDGRQLVFQANGGLWTIRRYEPRLRSHPRRLLKSGDGPSWSPDGREIAFTGNDGVYVVDTDGSNPRRVVGFAPGEFFRHETDWQPQVWPMRIF
jgi:Tol biopolymer transport system component